MGVYGESRADVFRSDHQGAPEIEERQHGNTQAVQRFLEEIATIHPEHFQARLTLLRVKARGVVQPFTNIQRLSLFV